MNERTEDRPLGISFTIGRNRWTGSEIARKNWRDCSLYAPYSGIIASKDAEVGQSVMPGVPVVSLVTGGKLRVKIAVPETEISRIAIGQKAAICIPALDNGVVSGQVVEKGIQANPLTRSYEVKIEMEQAEIEMKREETELEKRKENENGGRER